MVSLTCFCIRKHKKHVFFCSEGQFPTAGPDGQKAAATTSDEKRRVTDVKENPCFGSGVAVLQDGASWPRPLRR